MNRFIVILIAILGIFTTISAQDVNTYTKDEINLKLELLEEKVNAHLMSMSREDKQIDTKIESQDKIILSQDKQVESLKYIFGILLSVIALVAAWAGIFIDKRNQERTEELEQEIKEIHEEANKQLDQLREITRLEVHLARVELKEIKMEGDELIKALKERINKEIENLKNKL